MDEVKFCLKSLIVAILVVTAMQVRVSGKSVESHATDWLHNSNVPVYLQKVADGGALALRNAKKAISDFASHAFARNNASTDAQRASR